MDPFDFNFQWILDGSRLLGLEAPGRAVESEIQPQVIISIARVALLPLCMGLVWLLWNSNFFTERKRNAAIIAGMVHCLFSVITDLALVHFNYYHYAIDTYVYQGVPVDIHIVYGCLWGTGFCLLWESAGTLMGILLLAASAALAVVWDRWGMSSGYIYIQPGPNWQTANLIVQCALPLITVLFYSLIDENRLLVLRSAVYTLGYFALFYFFIPSIILSISRGKAFPEDAASKWQIAVVAVAVVSVPGAWAAGQYAISGRGTPLPLDPTHKLIMTGPYAYVRNPMQISCVGAAIVWAATSNSIALWVYVGVLLISLQFTRVHEEDDLHRRFGERYKKYCRRVWLWLPRLWAYEEE